MIAPHVVQKLLVEFQAQRRLDVVELLNDYLRLVEENQKLGELVKSLESKVEVLGALQGAW